MTTVPIWIITSCRQAVACWIKAALLLAGLSGMSCTAFADNNALLPQTYELHYQSKVRGFTVKAIQSLSVENGTYRLQQQTRAAILSIDETSLFRFDEQRQIIPVSYDYQRSVFGKKLNRANRFSHDRKSATFQENRQDIIRVDTPEPVLDQLNFMIAIQQELKKDPDGFAAARFLMLDDKKIREHHYRLLGNEWLQTDVGWLKTRRIERVRENSDKRTLIWLAEDWDYLIVRMQHSQEDEGEQNLYLTGGSVGGKPITGLPQKPAVVTPAETL